MGLLQLYLTVCAVVGVLSVLRDFGDTKSSNDKFNLDTLPCIILSVIPILNVVVVILLWDEREDVYRGIKIILLKIYDNLLFLPVFLLLSLFFV